MATVLLGAYHSLSQLLLLTALECSRDDNSGGTNYSGELVCKTHVLHTQIIVMCGVTLVTIPLRASLLDVVTSIC